jgi:hypothetical protein
VGNVRCFFIKEVWYAMNIFLIYWLLGSYWYLNDLERVVTKREVDTPVAIIVSLICGLYYIPVKLLTYMRLL